MKIQTLFFAAFLSCSAYAAADDNFDNNQTDTTNSYNYQISLDTEKQTAITGADLSMSFIEGYRMADDKITESMDSPWAKIAMSIPRLIMTSYVSTFQHEVFGHGAKIREIGHGWQVNSYTITLGGGGSTSYWRPINANPQARIAVAVAGTQATEVLSNKVKGRILESDTINPVYGAAYFTSSSDQIMYTYLTSYKESKGHDVQNYITGMNNVYGANFLTKSKIQTRTALSLLDPFLYYSVYALATGEDFEYPMIAIGDDWKYLPAFRTIWTPYGIENKWMNYFKTPYTPLQVNFIQGNNKCGTSWGAEVIADKIINQGSLELGLNLATWKQPKLFFIDPLKAPNKQGYSGEAMIKLNLTETSAIYSAIGYKTAGFRVGYPMKASALIRMGVAFKL